MNLLTKTLIAGLSAALVLCPHGVLACAACFGKSDSAMARGMNLGIFSLLAVVVTVLASVAGFFIFLARKSAQAAATAKDPAASNLPETLLHPQP